MDEATLRRLYSLLGLGVRGRLAVVGVEQVRMAAHRGRLAFAVVASDVSRHSLEKVLPLLQARRVAFVQEGVTAEALGAAVGRDQTAAVGILDRELARGVRALVEGRAARGGKSGPRGAP